MGCDVLRGACVFVREQERLLRQSRAWPVYALGCYYNGEDHMIHKIILLLTAAVFTLGAASISAGEDKVVIALKTDDFELAETDISELEIGDAETIYTQSGKTIDLLRTAEGVEIYVDGELLEMGLNGEEGIHEGHHIVHQHIEVECDTEEDCDADIELGSLHGEDHHQKVIIIKEKTEMK